MHHSIYQNKNLKTNYLTSSSEPTQLCGMKNEEEEYNPLSE